ncbi:MAG: PepSY domain-containing protein [Aquimonas sp.]|nr:PepSY domain-containing protein [Aquimonas sp.]
MHKRIRPLKRFHPLALAALTGLGLSLAAVAAPVQQAGEVAALLQQAGYAEVRDIELDSGLWEVEVRRDTGRWGEIHVDPATGEIFDRHTGRALLDAEAITRALEAQGYRDIKDLDREGATWDADAMSPEGYEVDLRVSAHDGRVLHSERDD